MKTPQSGKRFGMIVMLVFSTVLVLASFWVLEVMRRSSEETYPQGQRVDPDYFIDVFTFLRLSRTGKAEYSIAGKRLIHNPVDDTHAVQLPVVDSLSADRPPMKAVAQRGIVNADNSQVHLYDDVHIDRPASATASNFHLSSTYLLILPDEDIMQTDRAVEITMGKSILRGTGMVANNATRQLELASNVRATFQPPSATPRP